MIDGDTIVIACEHVCKANGNKPVPLKASNGVRAMTAQWLTKYLRALQVECVSHARDRYWRLLAVCYAGGESINAPFVREGWALDYRKYTPDYLDAEAEPNTGCGCVARRVRAALAVAKQSPVRLAAKAPCITSRIQ